MAFRAGVDRQESTVMAHQSFRPSDFTWAELPIRLAGLAAAPLIYVLRAGGCWPGISIASGERGKAWRTRVWRAVLVIWLLLPLSCLLVSGVSSYSLGRGWISHSTAMTLSRPAFLIVEQTPLKNRFGFLLLSIFNQGLKDGGLQISDPR
jgi:hypothetical protein